MSNIIVGIILAGIVFLAARRALKDMKNPGCSGCSSCSMKDKCNSNK